MKQRNDLWHIYYSVDSEKRIIVKDFTAKTEKDAVKVFEKVRSDIRFGKFYPVLENRNIRWWRIYKKMKSADGGITAHLFKAQTRAAAYRTYADFIKSQGIKDTTEWFYGSAWGHLTKNKDGTYTDRHTFFSSLDNFDSRDRLKREKSDYERGYTAAKDEYTRKYEKVVPYFVKTGHSPDEWYDLGYHILNDLEFNIPILMKKMNGFPNPFLELARKKASGKKPMDIDNTACQMWKDELASFYNHLLLYRYYSNYGIVDKEDKALAEIDCQYRNTLPIYPGTEEFDYKKLNKMSACHWKAISKWLTKWLLACWD